jgi:hypothetical protein
MTNINLIENKDLNTNSNKNSNLISPTKSSNRTTRENERLYSEQNQNNNYNNNNIGNNDNNKPFIRIKIASPPSGLRKFGVGGLCDTKTIKGTFNMKIFYEKYKKETSNYESVYYKNYLKMNEIAEIKDLDYYEKKYNNRILFKVRKNYDFFLENNLNINQDPYMQLKQRELNNRKKLLTPGKKLDKEYLEKLKNYKKTSETDTEKITDKKRLDILYNYDDEFKMRIENFKTSKAKKNMNLHDYQKQIVCFYYIFLLNFILFIIFIYLRRVL